MAETVFSEFIHLGRNWQIVEEGGHYFVKDDRGGLTGPWNEPLQARAWVQAIRP